MTSLIDYALLHALLCCYGGLCWCDGFTFIVWSTDLQTQQKQVCSMNDHEKGHLLTSKPITESHPSTIYQRKQQAPHNQAY